MPRTLTLLPLLSLVGGAVLAPTGLLAQTVALDGVVADEAGKPLAGATVELKPLLSDAEVARLLLSGKDDVPAAASAKSGADGRYSLTAPAPGMWIALASAPGRMTLQRELVPLLEPQSLGEARLPPRVEVVVRVLDADGRPVPHAFLQSAAGRRSPWDDDERRDSYGWGLPGNRALADAEGRLTLHRSPDSVLHLLAGAPGWLAVKAREVEGPSAEIRLERGCPRAVIALDSAGKPVAGVALESGDVPVALTGADGGARVTAPCGRKATLRWIAPDGRRGTETLPAAAAGTEAPPVLRIRLPARPTLLAGRVLERLSRKPIAGAWIWGDRDPGGAVRSDAAGGYALPLPEEDGSGLAAAAAGAGRTEETLDAVRRRAGPAGGERIAGPTLLLRATATVNGTAVDETGAPVAGARIEVQWQAVDSDLWRTPAQRTGPDGAFRLRLGAAEPFTLRASHPKRAGAEAEQPALKPAEVRSGLRLVLPPARGAYGRVVDVQERPVPGAEVTLSTSEGADPERWGWSPGGPQTLSATTDAEGRFRFDKLPEPPLDLEVRASGFSTLLVAQIEPPAPPAVPPAAAGTKGTAPSAPPLPADLGTVVLHPGLTLEGVVVDKAGKPVAGAAIRCLPENLQSGLRWMRQAMGPNAEVTSGLDGRFEVRDLPQGRKAMLYAYKKGYQQAQLAGLDVPGEAPLKVVLEPTFRVGGTVTGDDGHPLAHAQVGVTNSNPGWMGRGRIMGRRFARRATTDGDGHFEIELTEAGKVRLEAGAPGFLANGVDLEVPEPRDIEGVEIVLRRGAVLYGRVSGPDGAPLDEVRILIGEDDARFRFGGLEQGATSNSDGEYRVDGLAEGKETLTAQRQGYSLLTKEVEVGSGETRLDLRLDRAAAIEGRVLDPEGRPLGKAQVWAETEDGSQGSSSKADGTFSIPGVEPGTYQVWADHPAYGSSERVEAVLGATTIRGLELRLTEGSVLRGRILGLAFDQLPDVVVSAVRQQGEGGLRHREVSVDFEGRYRMAGLEPGDWHVSARFGSRSATGDANLPAGGGEAVLDLEFHAGSRLAGWVTRAGQPLSRASVLVQAKSGKTSGYDQTDSRGSFQIEGLEPGTYILTVVGYESAVRHRQEVEVPSPEELRIDLPSTVVSGRVVDGQGRAPLADAILALRRDPDSEALDRFLPPVELASDRDGSFTFQGVVPGRYRVTAEKEGFTRAELPLEVGESEVGGLEIELQRTGKQAVRVVAGSGGAVAAVQFALLDLAEGRIVTQGIGRPDEAGRIEVDALPGTWDLLVLAEGFATARQPVTLPGPMPTVVLLPPTALLVKVPSLRESEAWASLEVRDPAGRSCYNSSFQGTLEPRYPVFRGQGTVSNLPAGTWQLAVRTIDGKVFQGTATTRTDAPAEVELGEGAGATGPPKER